MKKPKLGDMVRVKYVDNGTIDRAGYLDAFKLPPLHLISRGRFIGAVNGHWFVENTDSPELSGSMHMTVIIAKCIKEVKNFGPDDSPLPEDLEDLLKEAGGK